MAVLKYKVGKVPAGHPLHRDGYEYVGICGCGYYTAGWPLKKQAQLRIEQHLHEHETGELMPHISEVEALTPDAFPKVDAPEPAENNSLWDEVK